MSENDQDTARKCDVPSSATDANTFTASDFEVRITPAGLAALEAWERRRSGVQYDDGTGFVAQCEEEP